MSFTLDWAFLESSIDLLPNDLPPMIVPLLKLEVPALGPVGQPQELEADT